jgi:hypothetical protein
MSFSPAPAEEFDENRVMPNRDSLPRIPETGRRPLPDFVRPDS